MKVLKIAIMSAALTAFGSPAIAGGNAIAETETVAKKPKKITDRNDPNYVRCRSEPVIGSLTRKRRVCMTNAQWKEQNQASSKQANEFVDDMQGGLNTSN